MAITFSHYLQSIRKEKKLTQQEVLELLIASDSTFAKLDLTTFSRWERGVTTPKLTKQLLITRTLGGDIAMLINPDVKRSTNKQNLIHYFNRKTLDPYSKNPNTFTTHHYDSLTEEFKLCQQLEVFHSDYLGMDIESETLRKSNLLLNSFVDQSEVMIGHFLYGFVPTDTKSTQLNPNKLSGCLFINPNELSTVPISMYIISSYSSLSAPRMMSILMILDALRQNTEIKSLYVNCHDQDSYNLYSANTEFDIITKGPPLPYGGIKVFGKHYRYVQLKIKAENILASKVVSSLVPFTDEYIQGLLGKNGQ
ncbi:XRE family transcriptional regulator [Aliivibrio finisterrensis]|uniref:helix-turn-helix transcriptional regulator n=1 Tax=Aliivibrio finisterrensis TaxID=511998 RepID=UPI00101EAB39|nr:helix-turn-helix domain-containing protein [Aliivibrio finisterrensis]RYU68409.1 XRE family transcriptional regulator [Aliivibrio finisterrensis]RYU72161.1 XRE family transcriptional regulator [Aliivibrio finisterrensis]RYU75677.1 XRE family transcriptional regulator [Aliivibrio finisterrensis]